MIENVDRRILGAFICVDAITGSSVVPAIPVTAPQWNVKPNRSGTYVIFDGPNLDPYTGQFLPSGTWPAAAPFEVTLQDPNLRYLPRRASVSAPSAIPAIPPVPAAPTGVFAPQQITVYPTPAAQVGPNWATMRVSVTQNGINPPQGLPFVVLRLVNNADSSVMATGQTDTNGEALLAYIGQTITVSTGSTGKLTTPSIAATLTAYLLPGNLNQPSGFVPDPDDILNNLTAAALVTSSQAITVISGQEQSLTFSLTVPA